MEALIFFALWAVFLFLMMRFGCGAHVMGHGGEHGSGGAERKGIPWAPPERETDPVCGKTVRTSRAKPSVHDGRVYWFCSRDCREIFEAAPEFYVGGPDRGDDKLEHSHA